MLRVQVPSPALEGKSQADRTETHLPTFGRAAQKTLSKTEDSVFQLFSGALPMPRLKDNQVPSYRRHKQSGQAIVTLSRKDHLLGTYGTKESRTSYDKLISEWVANGRRADYRYYRDADGQPS